MAIQNWPIFISLTSWRAGWKAAESRVNTLHPGFVTSSFGKNGSGLLRPFFSISQLLAISPQKGTETSVYLASSPEVEGATGKYFVEKKAVSSSAASYDQETARLLWEISVEMINTPTHF
jgi:hypothetical protein